MSDSPHMHVNGTVAAQTMLRLLEQRPSTIDQTVDH